MNEIAVFTYLSFFLVGVFALALWVLYINRHDMKPQDPKHH